MKVSEIRNVLYDLQRIYAAAGAKGPAKDMAELADAMATADEQDVDQFLAKLECALNGDVDPTARAEHHLLGLVEAGTDAERFAKVFRAIETDKSLKAPELDLIGSGYTMFPRFGELYKTRAAKLEQIKQTFQDKRNFESRGKVIDQLLPWQ